jgi:hypothetical protein
MIPLRLIVDTNIVVSAALKPDGLQHTVLLLSLAEYREVLARPKMGIRKGLQQHLLALIRSRSHIAMPPPAGDAGPSGQQVPGMRRCLPRIHQRRGAAPNYIGN